MEPRGVTIDGKHTYRDWGLRWVDPVEISEPEPKIKKVEIPGAKIPLDATESLYGGITYNNRTMTLHFYRPLTYAQWPVFDSVLQNALAGKAVTVYLDTEPEKYWKGRVTGIQSSKPNAVIGEYAIALDVEPYKYFDEVSTGDWLWDSFNFYSGVIRPNLQNLQVNGSRIQPIMPTGSESFTPVITATANMTVTVDGRSWPLSAGVARVLNGVVICQEPVNLTFSGTGKVSITLRGETL